MSRIGDMLQGGGWLEGGGRKLLEAEGTFLEVARGKTRAAAVEVNVCLHTADVPVAREELNWEEILGEGGGDNQGVGRLATMLKERRRIWGEGSRVQIMEVKVEDVVKNGGQQGLAYAFNVGFYRRKNMRGEVAPFFVIEEGVKGKVLAVECKAGPVWRLDTMNLISDLDGRMK